MTFKPQALPNPPTRLQRLGWQCAFFILFVLTPIFDIFRFDLYEGHAYLLGMPWLLGIDDFLAHRIGSLEAGLNILLRLFVPIVLGGIAVMYVAWRWGRIYCGWLCPHFSVVESINGLMRRASGKHSLWDKTPEPAITPSGEVRSMSRLWWVPTVIFAVFFAALWAIVLLTYLLPPKVIYSNLMHAELTANQARFIGVGTLVLTIEFLFARHLFCRFGCAFGVFQSLAWMANRGAMVIGFERQRAADCTACQSLGGTGYAACEAECPMRLRPRQTKQKMFTCTQCTRCVSACQEVQQRHGAQPLLRWIEKDVARRNEAQVSLTGKKD